MFNNLRFWLIRKLAGATPVLLNFDITVPADLGKPGVYVGSEPALIAPRSITNGDEDAWIKAKGVIQA